MQQHHPQPTHRGAPHPDERVTAAHRASRIDYDRLNAELLPVLERHGVIAPGETLDGWVGVLRFRGVRDDGKRYRRDEALTAPGISIDEADDMLATGTRLLCS